MTTESLRSIWQDTSTLIAQHPFTYPPLRSNNLNVDTVVIGGGITGLMAAYHLIKSGKAVAVLEAQRLGSGTTGRTTAHLTASYDHDYYELASAYDEKTAQMVCQSMQFAIDLIESTVRAQSIDCDFRRLNGYYYAESDSEVKTIQNEVPAARQAGLACEFTQAVPLPFPTEGGMMIANQAEVHPLRLLAGLAEAVSKAGGHIFEGSRVTNFKEGSPCLVSTSEGTVTANHIIMATHTPLGLNVLQTLLEPVMSYVLTAKLRDDAMVPDGLFWDAKEPYYYIRRVNTAEGPLVVVGGRDHKTGEGNADEAMQGLEDYARNHFPIASIKERWSAQLFEPADQLPYIGLSPMASHLYVGTGYTGDGMTLGALAGWMLAEQCSGRKTPFDELYRPARIRKAGVKKFLKHNLHVGATFLKDHLPAAVKQEKPCPLASLAPGEGCVGVNHGEHIAAYRDKTGELRTYSAICPHMRCHVRWNELNKSFDCPCHGSRFDTHGQQTEGPAMHPLSAVSIGALDADLDLSQAL